MLRSFRVYALEVGVAALGISWGLNLLNPWTDVFSHMQTTSNIQLFSENAWGAASLTTGLLHVFALRYRRLAFAAACFSTFFWFCVWSAFTSSNPVSTGVPTYACCMLNAILLMLTDDPRLPNFVEIIRLHRRRA